ncbi:biotin transporter BioY [Fictibacillus sp. KIGAM418]|uniref:Biotin transporter n=1 Tax=Fictibacillus marinisediminis TaxID=2878389 RepID=A0A9X1X948_9BACL|nr:biotin transporter BioY [Fictibacillus marinisediminis]MCK6256296.1 biotin transporter BioY [Fictibacillus marinisediminis]
MNTRSISYVALFAAMTAIGAFIKVPIPYIPFTLQILSVYLAGALLGPRLGLISQLCYVLIGLIGIPVFADGGGFSYVFKPTFGYLIGYVIAAFVNGWIIHRFQLEKVKSVFAANLASLLTVYFFGCAWLYAAMNWFVNTPFTLSQTFLYGFLLPVPGDLLLCFLCAVFIVQTRPRMARFINRKENERTWAKPTL